MSIDDLVRLSEEYNWYIIGYLIALPVFTFLLSKVYKTTPSINFLDYVFSTIIYLVSIPGLFSICLVAYSLLFVHQNLLQVNLMIYFLPLASMVVTFIIISGAAGFARLPGFKRLSGLMLLMAMVFIALFFLYRLRIHVLFLGSISNLFFIGIGIFVLMKIAISRMR